MSEKYIEKSFLYLLFISLLLHLGFGTLLYLMPPDKAKPAQETTTMVELKDLPEPAPEKPKPQPKPQLKRPLQPTRPVAKAPILPPERLLPQARKEAAPKAENKTERILQSKRAPNLPSKTEQQPQQPARSPGSPDSPVPSPEVAGKEAVRGEGLFKPQRGQRNELAKLFPSAGKMSRIEENFRKKYLDTERGDTRLMDTDDPDIGSFTRRYVIAVTDRLNTIDSRERKGLGTTILKVTINRDGSIGGISVLYSTGNRALDDLAIRASRTAGYVGPLPRRWAYDVLNMICSFTIQEGLVATRWQSY